MRVCLEKDICVTHCHAQQPSSIVPQLKILIRKVLRSIDTRTPRAIPIQKVAALNHKLLDHAMEFAVLVALWPAEMALGFACAELAEVFGGARNDVCEQLYFDASQRLAAQGGVEEDDWVCLSGHLLEEALVCAAELFAKR